MRGFIGVLSCINALCYLQPEINYIRLFLYFFLCDNYVWFSLTYMAEFLEQLMKPTEHREFHAVRSVRLKRVAYTVTLYSYSVV